MLRSAASRSRSWSRRTSRRSSSAGSASAPRSPRGCWRRPASIAFLARLPLDGHYFWDLFPAFVLGGAGLGFSFVPVTIASLTGVDRSDAGVASGLVNTGRQIGGAIGLAAVSAIAATSTGNYADAHRGIASTSAAALDHGFQTALYVLTGLAVVGAIITIAWIRPQPAPARAVRPDAAGDLDVVLDEAA